MPAKKLNGIQQLNVGLSDAAAVTINPDAKNAGGAGGDAGGNKSEAKEYFPPPEKEELHMQKPLPKWRRKILRIVTHWTFDVYISIFTLFFASILASTDINTKLDPVAEAPTLAAYNACQAMLVSFFSLEAILKIIAFGIFSRKARSSEELEIIFEHDPNAARTILSEQTVGEITDVFNLFDITRTGTVNRKDLRAASRALGISIELGSEEEALLLRPGPDVLDINEFICTISMLLVRGSELPGYFKSSWNCFEFLVLLILWTTFAVDNISSQQAEDMINTYLVLLKAAVGGPRERERER
mmetsp:Transcript_11018/g.30799  ORF Transcript_11018/g.30799 Transcript_11018/m.30799 type:complete len:300 (-) Transcript_11018:10-909(-)